METNNLYKSIFDSLPFGIAYCKLENDESHIDFQFVSVNNIFTSIFSFHKNSKNKDFSNDLKIDSLHKDQNLLLDFKNTVLDKKTRFYKKTINSRWYNIQVNSNKSPFFTLTFYDITNQILPEEFDLKKFPSLDASLKIGRFARWNMELPSERVFFDDEKAHMLGYSPDKFTHYSDFTNLIHPDDYDKTMNAFKNLINGTSELYDIEYRIKTNYGTYKDFRDFGYIVDGDGEDNLLFSGIVIDISEIKNITRKLNDQKQKYEHIIEATNAGTYQWNIKNGDIIFNDKWIELIGYNPEELSLLSLDEGKNLINKDDLIIAKNSFDSYMLGEQAFFKSDLRIKHKNGKWIWFHSVGKVISYDKDNKPKWFYGIIIDFSNQKRIEHSLLERVKELNAFYNLSKIVEEGDNDIDYIFNKIVNYMPTSMQFPEYSYCIIKYDDKLYKSKNYKNSNYSLSYDIKIQSNVLGYITIGYNSIPEYYYDNIFLEEEKAMLDSIAERIGRIIERYNNKIILSEKELKYKELFNNSNDAIYFHEMTSDGKLGRIIEVNSGAVEMLGYSQDEFSRMTPNDIDSPRTKPQIPSIIKSLYKKKRSTFFGCHVSKDGREIPVEISSKLIYYDNKAYSLSTVRDITYRVETEKELKANELKYRTIFEQFQDVYYETNRKGKIIEISPSVFNQTGYYRKELIGESLFKFIKNKKNLIDLLNKMSENSDSVLSEFEIFTKEGNSIIVSNISKLHANNGNDIKVIGSFRNITDQKIVEKEVHDLNKFEALASYISYQLVSFEDFESSVVNSLRKLCDYFNSERIQIMTFDDNLSKIETIHKWNNSNKKTISDFNKEVKIQDYNFWLTQLLDDNIIYISNVENITLSASKEKRFFETRNINNFILIPLLKSNNLIGIIEIDNINEIEDKTINNNDNLSRISGIFIQAFESFEKHNKLIKSTRKFQLLSELNMALLRSNDKNSIYYSICRIINKIGKYPYVLITEYNPKEPDSFSIIMDSQKEKLTKQNVSNENCAILKALKSKHFIKDNELLSCKDTFCANQCINVYKEGMFIPINRKSDKIFTLNICSENRDAFDKEETELLLDVSKYIEFGLNSIEKTENNLKYKKIIEDEKNELSATLRNIADGVLSVNTNGEILLANKNAYEILDFNDDLINKSIFEVFKTVDHKNDPISFNPIDYLNEKETNNISDNQLNILTKESNIKTIKITISGIRNKNNEIVRTLIVLSDITDKLKDEAIRQLSRKMESIGQLASGIAHEINTPLQFIGDNLYFLNDSHRNIINYIKYSTDLINDDRINNDDKKNKIDKYYIAQDIDFISKEISVAIDRSLIGIDRVGNIVRAMKNFAHPSEKEKIYSDINKSIQLTATISKNEWKYCADLTLHLDDNLPLVYCSIDEINQVVLNLVINSSHAIEERIGKTPETKGKIEIKTGMEKEYVFIEISDNGIGIQKNNLERIYDPFFTTKEVGRGTGQGLSIAHDIINNKHNGKIYVDSEINIGTTFLIKLPINKKEN